MSDYYYSTVDENSPETRLRMAYRQACTQLAHVAIGEAPARVPALMEANLSSRELLAASARALRTDSVGTRFVRSEMGELINSLKTAGCPILSEKVKLQLDGVASLLHDGDASRLGARASSVLASASREVALAERDYYSLVIEDSLVDLGYSVTRARGAAACAIEATRGHEVRVFGVSTSRDGAIEVVRDGAGLSGEACHEADVKIVDALERRGVVFGQPRSSRRHGDAKGGALIRELGARARNHSVSLAQAFVSMRDEREGKLGQQSKSSFAKTSDKSKGLYRAHTNSKRKAAHHE